MLFKVSTILVCCALVACVQGAITGRIVGGDKAGDAQFPYQVSVRMLGEHNCGGSIISEKHILTAAHCIFVPVGNTTVEAPAEFFSIRAGSNDRLHGGVVLRVNSITVHENYDGDLTSDVAVMELEKPLTFSNKIQPIELETEKVPSGAEVIISGWGYEKTNAKSIPIKLKYNTSKAISSLNCLAKIGVLSNQILCLAHEANNGACSGDSGGPAAYNGKLVGVAGFVVPACGTKNPDGYAKVSAHVEWINSIIA